MLNHSRAWLEAEGNLVVTASAGHGDFPWSSAVTRLIAGINEEFGEERYRFLRRRILCDGTVSDWDRNLVKVCAKRMSSSAVSSLSLIFPGAPTPFPGEYAGSRQVLEVGMDLGPDPASDRTAHLPEVLDDSGAIASTARIAAAERAKFAETKPHLAPRCVAAILVDQDGHLIAANVNTNAGHQMRHAEVNLLLSMASRDIHRIPRGAVLYTSLKPCRMCASLILAMQEGPDPVRIVALADDPGPHGRHNMLPGSLVILRPKAEESYLSKQDPSPSAQDDGRQDPSPSAQDDGRKDPSPSAQDDGYSASGGEKASSSDISGSSP